jgi:hypothetical protein
MGQEQHRPSRINMEKMKRPFPWSILDLYLNHVRIIVWEMRDVEEGLCNVEEEDSFRDWVDGEVHVVVPKVDDGVKDSVAEDLDGRITINLNVSVIQVFRSNQTGNYLKKSSSTDSPNSP